MVYILLTEIKDRHNYQRESVIGIFSSYLKGLDNNCRRYFVGLGLWGLGITKNINSLKVLQLDDSNKQL